MNANPGARLLLLAILEFIVGGIVLLRCAALVYFSTDATGKFLGVVHAIFGLLALPAAYLLLTEKAEARTLTLGVNAAIIAFSAISEIILSTTGSFPSGPFADSVVGTTAAVLIAIIIVYQLIRPGPQAHGAVQSPAC